MYAAGIIWYNIEQLSPTINFFEQLQQFQMVTSSDRDYLLLMILNISACYMYDKILFAGRSLYLHLIRVYNLIVKQKSLKRWRKFTNHHSVTNYTIQQ